MAPLSVLGLFEFARGALVFSIIPLYGQFVAGYSPNIIGTAIAVLYLVENLCRLPYGWLTDRQGGKWLICVGIIISAMGIFLIFTHWNPSAFILGAGLFGMGIAPLWPAVISRLIAKMPAGHVGEALSKVFIAWLAGAGLGMVVITYFVGQFYTIAFEVLYGVLAIAWLLTAFWELPSGISKRVISTSVYLKELHQELISLRILYPGMFVQTMAVGLMTPVIAIYARTVFGFSTEQFACFLMGGGFFTVILLIPAGRLADSFGIKWPLIVGFLLASIGLVLFPMQHVLTHAMLLGVLIGIAYSLIIPAWNGLMAQAVSREKMGTMWAFFMTVEGVGTAAGAYLGGKVWSSFGQQAPFFASAFVLGTMAIFYAFGNIDQFIKVTAEKS